MSLVGDNDAVAMRGACLKEIASAGRLRITVEREDGPDGCPFRVRSVQRLSVPGYVQVKDGDTVARPLP